jgi:hypothetical protein
MAFLSSLFRSEMEKLSEVVAQACPASPTSIGFPENLLLRAPTAEQVDSRHCGWLA